MSAQNDRPAGIVSRRERPQDLHAVHLRHSEIQNQKIRRGLTDQSQCFTTIARRANVIPAQAKKSHQKIARHHVVIDDKDLLIGKLIYLSPGMRLLG